MIGVAAMTAVIGMAGMTFVVGVFFTVTGTFAVAAMVLGIPCARPRSAVIVGAVGVRVSRRHDRTQHTPWEYRDNAACAQHANLPLEEAHGAAQEQTVDEAASSLASRVISWVATR